MASRHHTQFRVTRRHTERTVIGTPMIPGYAPRSLGLLCAVVAVLFLLGGLVQINPIWLWGPYHLADGTNGAQPDRVLVWVVPLAVMAITLRVCRELRAGEDVLRRRRLAERAAHLDS